MKTLIIYDSAYGNTGRVALAIAQALSDKYAVQLVRVDEADDAALAGIDLLVVGSPTQGGRPTLPILDFIKRIPSGALQKVQAATFDTRFATQEHGFGLRMLMRTIGFAAPKIATALKAKGASILTEPKGFIVKDKEGPLRDGELDRATHWAKIITNAYKALREPVLEPKKV